MQASFPTGSASTIALFDDAAPEHFIAAGEYAG
jgi:hypothetical protein